MKRRIELFIKNIRKALKYVFKNVCLFPISLLFKSTVLNRLLKIKPKIWKKFKIVKTRCSKCGVFPCGETNTADDNIID